MNLHCIHGFLGHPSDWNILQEYFAQYQIVPHAIETFLPKKSQNHISSFRAWAQNFNQSIFKNIKFSSQQNVLVGYSLGGRLALHTLLEENQWDAAVIISTNPGLTNSHDKESRLIQDTIWAKRFLNEPWIQVLHNWNAQPVFSNQINTPKRNESLYSRKALANMLLDFSLAHQKDLRHPMLSIKIPLLWLTGEYDHKFSNFSKELLKTHSNFNIEILKHSGHRLPWEQPQKFMSLLQSFLDNIKI